MRLTTFPGDWKKKTKEEEEEDIYRQVKHRNITLEQYIDDVTSLT